MTRYVPAVGDRVQLWYAMRNLFPFHARIGTAVIVGGSPLNVLVQLDNGGPAVVVPYGNVCPPQPESPQLVLL